MSKDLFLSNLPSGMHADGPVERRLLAEYGAMFVARGVIVSPKIVFRDEDDVVEFQSGLSTSAETIGGSKMELQSPAMNDLRAAIEEANDFGLSITPRDADSARRSYPETVGLWASRVEPALLHWVREGKLSQKEADRISGMSPYEQVPEIFMLEENGIFFAKDLSKSIIYSVAPPGTSQHLSMLAFDIKEHADAQVRELLAKHKWFQTVVSDLPHFTYLGANEAELSNLGLKTVMNEDREFWVPDI